VGEAIRKKVGKSGRSERDARRAELQRLVERLRLLSQRLKAAEKDVSRIASENARLMSDASTRARDPAIGMTHLDFCRSTAPARTEPHVGRGTWELREGSDAVLVERLGQGNQAYDVKPEAHPRRESPGADYAGQHDCEDSHGPEY